MSDGPDKYVNLTSFLDLPRDPELRISVADLAPHSLLKVPTSPLELCLNGIEFRVASFVADNELFLAFYFLSGEREGFAPIVQVTSVPLTFGTRVYFVCPKLQKRCLVLRYHQGELISEAAYSQLYGKPAGVSHERLERILFRLQGTNGKGRARGTNRRNLIYKLRWSAAASRYPPVAEFLAAEAAREEKESKRKAASLPAVNLLTSDIRKYVPGPTRLAIIGHERRTPQEHRASMRLVPVAPSPAIRPWGVLEDHAQLDLRHVLDWYDSKHRPLSAHKLSCPALVAANAAVMLIVDRREPDRPFLVVRLSTEGHAPLPAQLIELVKSSDVRGRWQMVCPISEGRYDILLLRDGVFASRGSQRLKHRSQIRLKTTSGAPRISSH